MSPAPKKPPAAKAPPKPRAAKPKAAAEPSSKPTPPAVASGTGATVAGGPPRISLTPTLSAGTGVIVAGGSASAPLPSLTRKHPPAIARAPRAAALAGPTPGAALARGGALDEPRPKPVQVGRVIAAPLETGLSDYAFWTEYLTDHEPAPAPPGGFRGGRIWR